MSIAELKKRKIAIMIFRFFIFYSVVAAQEKDSAGTIHLQGGTGYLTLISQKTASTAMDVFSKDSYLRASYAIRNDTLAIGIGSHRTYGRYSNSSSIWSIAMQYDVNDLWCRWSSSAGIVNYSISANVVQGKSLHPGFSLQMRLNPFDGKISGEIGYSLEHERAASTVVFQDFLIPLGVDNLMQRSYFRFTLQPADQFRMTFGSYEQQGESFQEKRHYDARLSSNAFGRDVGFLYAFFPRWQISGAFSIQELRPAMQMNTNGILFTEFPLGTYSRYHARVAVTTKYQDAPWTFAVDRDEFTLNESGIVQSWPFTSLAASVITNRFLFTLDGSLLHHQAEIGSEFRFGDLAIIPLLSYHYIIPEYQLKHWQPQFLVFGASNVSVERSTIVEAQLTRLDLSLGYSVGKGRMTLRIVQFIPVQIRYTATPSQSGTGAQPVVSRDQDRLDGGRFIGISFSY
ncbi:MAG: hypothetical protein WCW35_14440 [Bacteroidota bacterium]